MSAIELGRYGEMWRGHAGVCPQCKQIDLDHPATIGLACIPGASILKDLADVARRELAREGSQHAKR